MELRLLIREFAMMTPVAACQAGIYLALRQNFGASKWGSRATRAFAVFALAALFVNLMSSLWMLGFELHGPFWIALDAVDGVGLTALFTSSCIYLVYVVCRWMGRLIPETVSTERRKLLQTAGAVAMASPVAATAFGILVGRVDFGVREVSLAIPGLAPDLEGLRILQISDIHLGEFLSKRDLERVVDMSNGLRPHLAIMTGDLISKPGDPIEECVRQLARVRADAGMLGCLGNHEKFARAEATVKAEAARRGIPFLRHEHRQLRFGEATLNVAGVDYQKSGPKKDYLKGAGDLRVHGALNLLLSHNPDVFPAAADQGWGLTLSGHTHGGQVTVEIVEQTMNVARFFTPYVAGEYHLGNASCYVTRGIGTVGVPVRLGVPPEITLIKLRKA